MSEENITRVKLDAKNPSQGKTDWSKLAAMTDEEVHTAALSDPDCQPMSEEDLQKMRRVPDVKAIRRKLGMTQKEFASQFQISLAALRDWEQHRSNPDHAAKTLLVVIATNPQAVLEALEHG